MKWDSADSGTGFGCFPGGFGGKGSVINDISEYFLSYFYNDDSIFVLLYTEKDACCYRAYHCMCSRYICLHVPWDVEYPVFLGSSFGNRNRNWKYADDISGRFVCSSGMEFRISGISSWDSWNSVFPGRIAGEEAAYINHKILRTKRTISSGYMEGDVDYIITSYGI